MYFESVSAAIAMDGHGAYVWGAYALTLVVVLYLVVSPLLRQRRLIRELRGEERRNRQRQAGSSVEIS